jgi:hypothetical protein
MYGHIDEMFYRYYGGIQQEKGSIGWRKVMFEPHPLFVGNGAWINATYYSPRGLLTSSSIITSSLEGMKKVKLGFTCPIAVECTALLPLSKKDIHVPGVGAEVTFEDTE